MPIRFLVFTLSLSLLIPPVLAAQTQAVSPSERHQAIKESAQTRHAYNRERAKAAEAKLKNEAVANSKKTLAQTA